MAMCDSWVDSIFKWTAFISRRSKLSILLTSHDFSFMDLIFLSWLIRNQRLFLLFSFTGRRPFYVKNQFTWCHLLWRHLTSDDVIIDFQLWLSTKADIKAFSLNSGSKCIFAPGCWPHGGGSHAHARCHSWKCRASCLINSFVFVACHKQIIVSVYDVHQLYQKCGLQGFPKYE